MTFKEKLEKMLKTKQEQRNALNAQMIESESKEERAAIGETLKALASEIADVEEMLANVDKPADNDGANGAGAGDNGQRSFNPIAAMQQRGAKPDTDDVYATTEYRKAFQQYMVSGQIGQEFRATTKTTDSNVSAVIPTNLASQILEKFEQLGVIYNLVTRTSYPVGQTIAVDGVKPTATWVNEGAGSTPQSKTLSASITFTHFKLRCEIRYTEEVATMTLPMFEALFVKQVSEAMLRAIEGAIVDGDGTSKPKGILTYTAPEGQALQVAAGANNKLTYKVLCDAEAAIPTQYEATAKWCMTKKTFMQFVGMVDSTGQPIARVNYGINGKPERVLLGRDVVIYAPQANSKLKNYSDTSSTDDIFAFIVDFSDYVLNENYNLGISHAKDWDNEDHKTKAVAAYDGKLIMTDSLVTLTKTKTGG